MKKFRKPDPRGPRPPQANQMPKGRCVVGLHAVNELLKVRPRSVTQLWFREKYVDHPELAALYDLAKAKQVRLQVQSSAGLDRVIGSHQGVIAFSDEDPDLDWPALEKAETSCLMALDEVEDPHNLGAVLRTAWLFGAAGVITPEHRSAHLSPAVSKVAQGAAEHVPVERVANLPQTLKDLKDAGFWILGLSHEAKQSLFKFEIPSKVVWVLGSESSGLRKSVSGVCDDFVRIPQSAPEASYNVSVAGAIALAETYRQHLAAK